MTVITSQEYKPIEDYADLDFVLPGHGEAYEWCGKWYWRGHFSGHKLHWMRVKRSCHRFECPVCWHDWQRREAHAMAHRLRVYSEIHHHRKIVHFVLSPPEDVSHSLPGYREARNDAYYTATSRGIKGGAMVYHERACRFYNEKAYTEKHAGFRGCHYHVLGDGWLISIAELYEKDGWVVKNVGIREVGGLYKTCEYLLDHCLRAKYPWESTAPRAKVPVHTVTWFGTMAYNKLRISKINGEDSIYCPVCEEGIPASDWFILSYQGQEGPPEGDHGESVEGPGAFVVERPLTTPFWG